VTEDHQLSDAEATPRGWLPFLVHPRPRVGSDSGPHGL